MQLPESNPLYKFESGLEPFSLSARRSGTSPRDPDVVERKILSQWPAGSVSDSNQSRDLGIAVSASATHSRNHSRNSEAEQLPLLGNRRGASPVEREPTNPAERGAILRGEIQKLVQLEVNSQVSDLRYEVNWLKSQFSVLAQCVAELDGQAAVEKQRGSGSQSQQDSLAISREGALHAELKGKLADINSQSTMSSMAFGLENSPQQNRSYTPLRMDDTSVVTSNPINDDQLESERPLPESMFAYCMTMIPLEAGPLLKIPATYFFICALFMQQMLLIAVSDTAIIQSLSDHWEPSSEASAFDCTFSGTDVSGVLPQNKYRTIGKMPLVELCVAMAAIYVVAVSIMQDDREVFETVYHSNEGSIMKRLFLKVCFFLGAAYQPSVFALGAANIFANSGDSLEIVMNAVAVSFILNIDDMVYENFLTEAQKEKYQSNASHANRYSQATVFDYTWYIFGVVWVAMLVMFCNLKALDHLAGDGYYDQFFRFFGIETFLILVPACRCLVLHLAEAYPAQEPGEEGTGGTEPSSHEFTNIIAVFVGGGVCAKVMNMIMHSLFSPAFHNRDLLHRCLG